MTKKNQQQQVEEEGKIIQLILFRLGDEEFGAHIDQVKEIIRAGVITPIPDSPDFITGVANVAGEIAVIIDLKSRFALQVKEVRDEKHIIMREQDNNLFGLLVDEVTGVLKIPEADIQPTPELVTRIDRSYISGVISLDDQLIIVIDLNTVLSEEDLIKLSEFRIKHSQTVKQTAKKTKKKEPPRSTEELVKET